MSSILLNSNAHLACLEEYQAVVAEWNRKISELGQKYASLCQKHSEAWADYQRSVSEYKRTQMAFYLAKDADAAAKLALKDACEAKEASLAPLKARYETQVLEFNQAQPSPMSQPQPVKKPLSAWQVFMRDVGTMLKENGIQLEPHASPGSFKQLAKFCSDLSQLNNIMRKAPFLENSSGDLEMAKAYQRRAASENCYTVSPGRILSLVNTWHSFRTKLDLIPKTNWREANPGTSWKDRESLYYDWLMHKIQRN